MSPNGPDRRERHEAMLDAALEILRRDAALGLVNVLSIEKVAREAGLPATARRDWEGPRGAGLLQALADERLNATQPETLGEFATGALSSYPSREEGGFAAWYLQAMREFHQISVHDPLTITSLLVTAVAATSSDLAAGATPSSALAARLAEGRRRHYEELTQNYTILFDQVLSDMGRRLVQGIDTATLIRLNIAMHDGALLRRYLEPDAFDADGSLVARAQLALLEALSEPVAVTPDPDIDPLAWVTEVAPIATLACTTTLTVARVIEELERRADGAIGAETLRALLVEAYPDELALWDVALRWRLAPIAAILQLRHVRPDSVILQQLLHKVRDLSTTHPALAAAVCAEGVPNGRPYLSSLVDTTRELLTDLAAPQPGLLAPRLIELALEGHYDVVSTLLGATDLPAPPGGWA